MRGSHSFIFLSLLIQGLFIATGFASDPSAGGNFGPTSRECFSNPDLNFGIVIYNPYYKISRSSGLGKKGLEALQEHLSKNGLLRPKKIIYLNSEGYAHNPLASLNEAKKATSDKFTDLYLWLKRTACGQQIYYSGPFASEEESYSLATESEPESHFEFVHGGNRNVYVHGGNPVKGPLEPMEFKNQTGEMIIRSGGKDALYQVLEEILTVDIPLHFHCVGGLHRTGMTALMTRYLQGGSWIEPRDPAALGHPGWDAVENLAELEYYHHNPYQFRRENLEAIRMLSQESRFQCLQKEFSFYLNYPSEPQIHCYPRINPGTLEPIAFPVEERKAAWQRCLQT